MKYTRLTKEQFTELHLEFINFLATQSIGKDEWDQIKSERPEVAEQELDVFSDLIWEGVLTRAGYLDHFSPNHIFLFHCLEAHIHSIVLKSFNSEIDFLSREGLQWLNDNLFTDAIEIKVGKREFTDRSREIFELIMQGTQFSEGSCTGRSNL